MADTSGSSPWIVDVLALNLNDLDISQLPALSCSAARTATLQGNLNVTAAATVGTTLTVTQLLTAKAGLSVTSGTLTVSGDVSIGGGLALNGHNIFLNGLGDRSHGIGLYQAGDLIPAMKVDGPVVYGNTGGALGTTSNGLKIALSWTNDGKLNSPMWKVTRVIAQAGPLPLTGQFTSGGGTLVVFFSGTARIDKVASMTLTLSIDGKNTRNVTRWVNEGGSHKTFPSLFEVFSGYGAGTHTINIETKDALTDSNDYFYATVMEFPF